MNSLTDEEKLKALGFVTKTCKKLLAPEPAPLSPFERELCGELSEKFQGMSHDTLSALCAVILMRFTEAKSALILGMTISGEVGHTFQALAKVQAERADMQAERADVQEAFAHLFKSELSERVKSATMRAKKAADALHDQEGGNRAKWQAIRNIWASGKYRKRDVCAEKEHGALRMSFDTARKALRNMPDPA